MLAFSTSAFSLDYTISFTGSGASTTIDNVVVQNLTKNTTVTVPTGNTLNLVSSITTTVENSKANNANMRIFTNALTGKSTLSFLVKNGCATQLNVFSIDGRKVISHNQNLQEGLNSFEVSLPQGIFLTQVEGYNFSYTGKIISQSEQSTNPTISLVASSNQETAKPQKAKSETAGITQMEYTTGDQLLFKAVSSIYSTIVTDIPIGSKTVNFILYDCTDADGNHYSTVTIGTQVWMAENLRNTTFQNVESIPSITDNNLWTGLNSAGYCTYNNTVESDTIIKYGCLYNWYAVSDTRKIAPVGWHIASDAEWTTLTDYITTHLGISLSVPKALATTIEWTSSSTVNAVGNSLNINNSSGFSGLAAGIRSFNDGSFGSRFSYGCFWSTTGNGDGFAWRRYLGYYLTGLGRSSYGTQSGMSVRCIKD